MFTYAIVRPPPKSMVEGITTAKLGSPDYENALRQHQAYVEALRDCGLTVIALPAEEDFPDGCFVEDTALLTKHCAIVARLGTAVRQGEEAAVRELLPSYFDHIESIAAPGTVEPGDIMMAGDHFYIGLSQRTNAAGARQIIAHLENYDFTASTIDVHEMLHLKTGLAYVENNNLVVTGHLVHEPAFASFNVIALQADEAAAANCIWVNGAVILPSGCPAAEQQLSAAGYRVIPLDVSEFQKLDGGLSCLSLRF
jgi:dimethylargininase